MQAELHAARNAVAQRYTQMHAQRNEPQIELSEAEQLEIAMALSVEMAQQEQLDSELEAMKLQFQFNNENDECLRNREAARQLARAEDQRKQQEESDAEMARRLQEEGW